MLTEEQIDRYARHILLREVGGVGQEKLLAASVAIDGLDAGGWLVSWLALAGVGAIRLRDPRPVGEAEVAPLLAAADLGQPRDVALAAAVPAFNSDVRVAVGKGGGLQIRGGLPPAGEAGEALWYAAAGDHALILPPGARACASCLQALPAAPPSASAASLAGSVAGGEALLLLLGRAGTGRPARHFHRGEPVDCTHGP